MPDLRFMENRSRGMQLSIILLGLGAVLLLTPPADAFYRRLRTGRDIEHHQHYHNCPPDCPGNHVGLLPIHNGKYPPIGKSAHYHPQGPPPYYGNQPPYNIQPIFDGQQPMHNAPPVTYNGPPPSYEQQPLPPPPPLYEQPPPPQPSYKQPPPPPPSYEQLPPPPPQPSYEQPPPPQPSYEQPPPPPPPSYEQPPPSPPYNAPPPQYNAPPSPYSAQSPPYNLVPLPALPPPPAYNLSPPRDAPPPPSIYIPPLYNSYQSPFRQIMYDSRPSFNLPPAHHHAPRPYYEQPPAQENSQRKTQLIFELADQKNNSSPPSQLDSKDIALKLESNDSSTSLPTESTDSPLNLTNPSSSDSEFSLPLILPDYSLTSAPESPFQYQIEEQIPDEPSNTLPFNLPSYTLYNSEIPRTYQATMAYKQNPRWKEVHSEYRPIASNYDRPPSQPLLFNRIPRNFDYESFSLPEYRLRSFHEPDAGGSDYGCGKTLRHFSEFEREPSDGFFNEFERRTYEDEPSRLDRHYRYPGDENPYKSYRPYKRHDHYVQNNYDLENEQEAQYQPYVDAIRGQQRSIVPPGLEISQEQLESIIKQAIYAVRQEEAEELAGRRYGYESPYAEEPPAFVTMQQPKRYQLEPYGAEEPAARDIEWTPVDSTPGGELDLGDAGLEANAEEQPPQADLLEDLEQPPPTVTEPTIVDLLPTTSTSR